MSPALDRAATAAFRFAAQANATWQTRRRFDETGTSTDVISATQARLLERFAPDRTVLDVGGMWRIDGHVAFRALDLGATAATEFDAMEASSAFHEANEGRSEEVRYVRGDAHFRTSGEATAEWGETSPFAALADAGVHDVVWCTGVLYHTPDPHRLVANLLRVTGEVLVLGSKTIPELPGLPGAAVFYPAMSADERAAVVPLYQHLAEPHDLAEWREYVNWWWGLTPSAVAAMVTSQRGWRADELLVDPRQRSASDNCHVVVRRT